jgi:DNA-binding NtrC family response regulator
MKSAILLLTQDIDVEEQSAEAARRARASLISARDVDEAIQIVCTRGQDLELAIIDFDNGCRGMTLLNALNMLRRTLPIVVVTSGDTDHAAAFAYSNGAAACLAKPINATELEIVIRALGEPKLQLKAA